MTDLYSITNSSKQALHQFLVRQIRRQELIEIVVSSADSIRERHPRMSCRSIHDLLPGIQIGRDRCEQILLSYGFRVSRKRSLFKTTQALKHVKFPDLIKGLTLTGINQVWQSDITHFSTDAGVVFYIIFIQDVYSRKILAWSAETHMRAEANIVCLQSAIDVRKRYELAGLIHHSDRGSQYGDNEYLDILRTHYIRISMSKQAWQNGFVERVNGTIKNNYLYNWKINTLTQLRRAVKRAVDSYNNEKPHRSLPKRMSPGAFEKYLMQSPKSNHPTFKIYNYDK